MFKKQAKPTSQYKQKLSLEKRIEDVKQYKAKWSNLEHFILVRIEPYHLSKYKQNKMITLMLQPQQLSLIIHDMVRKKLSVSTTESLFLFCEGILLNFTTPLSVLQQKHCDEDGSIYIFYAESSPF